MTFYNWQEIPSQEKSPGRTLRALTTDKVTITRVEHVGPTYHAPHAHDDVEQIMNVMEGEFEVTLDDEVKMVKPGDVIVIKPGVYHGVRVAEGDTALIMEVFSPPRYELVKK